MGSNEIVDLTDCTEFRQIIQARSPRLARGSLIILVLLLASALAWSALSQVDIVVQAPCNVRPLEIPCRVQVPIMGEVAEVLFHEGQQVLAGDLLMRLRTDKLEAEISKLEWTVHSGRKELAQLATLREALEGERRELFAQGETELEIAQDELHQEKARAQEVRSNLALAQAAVASAERDLESYRSLFEQHVVSKTQLNEFEDALRDRRLQVDATAASVRLKEFGVELAGKRLLAAEQARQAAVQTSRAKLQELDIRITARRIALEQQEHDVKLLKYDREQCRIAAPITGRITTGEPRPGDIVKSGQVVANIAPPGLRIDAHVPNSESAGLYLGQRARIKLHAYDYRKYGVVEGEIYYIAPDASVIDLPGQGMMSAYLVKIRLSQDLPGPSGNPPELGMTGMAEIVTDRDRILNLAFRKLMKNTEI